VQHAIAQPTPRAQQRQLARQGPAQRSLAGCNSFVPRPGPGPHFRLHVTIVPSSSLSWSRHPPFRIPFTSPPSPLAKPHGILVMQKCYRYWSGTSNNHHSKQQPPANTTDREKRLSGAHPRGSHSPETSRRAAHLAHAKWGSGQLLLHLDSDAD
jgi:hypothetical protein